MALRFYQKTLAIDPDMAYLYSIHGQYKTAIEIYQKVLLLKPDYIDAYSGIADAYYAIKDYPNALKSYQKIFQLDPGNQYAYHKIKILEKTTKE